MNLPINYNDVSQSMRRNARNEYIKMQDGLCWYCKNPLELDPTIEVMLTVVDASLFPKGFFNWPIHLHHNHETGMTIGAVHCYCNAVLWQYHEQ